MNHAEAAKVLRCSEKTVSWRMHKARKILRDRLHPFLTGRAA
jgi:DNA-directed RNA polymerase specialized sigma24 family protein